MSEEENNNQFDYEDNSEEQLSDEDWTLDKLEKTEYLQDRKSYFADEVYKIGAAVAAILVIVALFAMT